MRNTSFFLIFMLVSLISAGQANTNTGYTTGKDGLEYKIISNGSGKEVQYGDFMQFHLTSYYSNGINDSLMNDSRKKSSPFIERLDSTSTPAAYFDILRQARIGDSVVIRVLTDSIFKDTPDQTPPFCKKGSHLLTCLKILNLFTTEQQADSARAVLMAENSRKDSVDAVAQFAKEDKILNEYFEKNNIRPIKAPRGTYINILKKGTGNNITTKDKVKVNYTGRTFSGKVFDSNTDSAFKHVEPLEVDMSAKGVVIAGWEEGLLFMNKGAKSVLYIPSPLGWPNGAGADIPPNEIVIFDIEIVSVGPVTAVIKPVIKKGKSVSKPKTKKAGK